MSDWYTEAFYRVSIVGLIRNDKNQILMVNEHDRWTIPGGGWDHGESLHEALKRELFEEIALVTEFTESVIDAISFYNPNKYAWQMWIACEISYDDLNYGVGEHATDVQWMDQDKIDYTTMAGKLLKQVLKK